MVAQNGRDLLIKMDMTGDGAFVTVAGLRSASVSGSGVFRDADTDARARQVFFDGETPRCQVVIPDFGVIEGKFQISALEYAGNYDGEASYEISLVSAGALSFVAL